MVLTRILIDKPEAAKVKLFDSYAWHRSLWHAFPGKDGEARDFLFRVDDDRNRFRVLLLSDDDPLHQPWGQWEPRRVRPDFLSHDRYRFQVRANPTMKKTFDNGKKRIGLYDESLLREWMHRKAEQGGFALSDGTLQIGPALDVAFVKERVRGKHVSVDFKGVLQVRDRTAFQDSFKNGIGSAKSFGFGLLMLQPVME